MSVQAMDERAARKFYIDHKVFVIFNIPVYRYILNINGRGLSTYLLFSSFYLFVSF